MKKAILSIFLISITLTISFAQQPESIPLSDGDIERFIKTYKPLMEDFENAGQKFDGIKDPSSLDALRANKEMNDILKKHGWDEQWIGKTLTITASYGILKIEEQLKELPEDQRKQYEQFLSASTDPLKEMTTDEDIKRVSKHVADLDELFDNE